MPEPMDVIQVDDAVAPAIEMVDGHQNSYTEEGSEMIDVHAPHGGLHTWKDFWIHLGTITLGLLIAISLEQTVEYFHHLHLRHQLEEDLHAEAEKNITIMDADYVYLDLQMANLAANRERVDAMRASHGKIKAAYTPFNYGNLHGVLLKAPLASVWTTAKEDQSIAFLPREEARFYDRVYRQQESYVTVSDRRGDLVVETRAFEAQFASTPKDPWDPIDPDLSRMSAAQLDEESTMLNRMWVTVGTLRTRLDYFYTAETAVLQGSKDENVLQQIVHRPVTLPSTAPDTASEASPKETE